MAVVIYGNGPILTGGPPSGLWGAPLPRFGLDLLFAMSGYLIAGSWIRRPQLLPFLIARARRVWPGLAGCVVVTILVIGAMATHLPLRQYAANGMTLRYLKNIVLIEQLWLPRVFEGQGWAGAVNPMLWTLRPALLCCLVLPACGLLVFRVRCLALGIAAIVCGVTVLSLPLSVNSGFDRIEYHRTLTEVPFFLMGVLLRHVQERRVDLWRADIAMLFFAGNWIVATWLGAWNIVLEWISLPYMAICFGHVSAPVLGRLGRLGNPSYGFYLYAFPIQQLIVARLPHFRYPVAACTTIALAAGYMSWHLIEKPALHWTGPGERVRHLARSALAFVSPDNNSAR